MDYHIFDIDDTLIHYTPVFLANVQSKIKEQSIRVGWHPDLDWSDLFNQYLKSRGLVEKRQEILDEVDLETSNNPYFNLPVLNKTKTISGHIIVVTARPELDPDSALYTQIKNTINPVAIIASVPSGSRRIEAVLQTLYIRGVDKIDSLHFYDDNEHVGLNKHELHLALKRTGLDDIISPNKIHFTWIPRSI
jgi:hypothetical protein